MSRKQLLMIGGATQRMRDQLSEMFDIHDDQVIPDLEAFLHDKGASIDAICAYGGVSIPANSLDVMPNLKVISGYGVGYDGLPAADAAAKGIMVTHTPDVLNDDVANLAILLLLAVSRRLVRDDAYARSGKWATEGNAPLTRSIAGTKIGILGLGRIGEAVAEKLAVFGVEIVYHSRNQKPDSPYRYYASLEDMAQAVDTIIIVVPGGAATKHLVNRNVLEALGPEGTLINIGRGSVVDEVALLDCLQSGKLGAAGLDVFEDEPQIPQGLIELDQVVLTPHVGSATQETRRAMGDLTVENLVSYFDTGRVKTPVPECRHLQSM